jgi:ATP-dependent Lhr-like helicase
MRSGRWFRLDTFSVLGRHPDRSEAAAWQARLLLERYGILVKEFYRFETGLLPWYDIFQALKKLEWQGEIRRGYFVKGLSGIQFALPDAVELLSQPAEQLTPFQLLNVLDPALPFGGNLSWPLDVTKDIVRSPGNHIGFAKGEPLLYTERYFTRWYISDEATGDQIEGIVALTRNRLKPAEPFRRKRKIQVELINDTPAAKSRFAARFYTSGYEQDGTSLVLWPSAL